MIRSFLLIGFVFGALFVFLLPPGAVPDESIHFLRAYHVSQGELFPEKLSDWGGGSLPATVSRLVPAFHEAVMSPEKRVTLAEFRSVLPLGTSGEPMTKTSFSAASLYPFVPYVPSALGIAAARQLGMKLLFQFYAGRLSALVVALLCLALALKCLPGFQPLFFLLALNPVALQELGSYSADSLTIALALFTVALWLKAAASTGSLTPGEGLGGLSLAALLSACKPSYGAAALLFFALSPAKLGDKRRYAAFGIVLVAIVAAVTFWSAQTVAQFMPPSGDEPGYPVSSGGQLHYLLAHPLAYATILVRTVSERGELWFKMLFNLGYLNLQLNETVRLLWLSFVVIALGTGSGIKVPARFRGVSLLLGLAGALFVLTSMYLNWTRVGAPLIEGVQGRYFLPVLPLLLLPFGASWAGQSRVLLTAFRVAAVVTLVTAVVGIVGRYYVGGVQIFFSPGVTVAAALFIVVWMLRGRKTLEPSVAA